MKLQIAFDMPNLDQALSLAITLQEHIDIMEIGSPLIYAYGKHAVEQFRAQFPFKTLLADVKIVDRGQDASRIMLQAGADWVTVLAGTSKSVIHTTATTTHDLAKKVMLDLIDASSPGQSALEAASLGVDALLFHQPADDEDTHLSFLERWDMVRGNTKLPIFIAAPVTKANLQMIIDLHPEGIVLSKSVTESTQPLEEVQEIRRLINNG